ncbi:hypothetical protein MNBD_ALPHA04-1433 [hydrothermal vent metagenome]|uniref:Efflux ABC transporter, permease/ATP-binding protein n=1 Tax=hydrothermal vent metagenome TaxID=652676 RepID=A0A3B0T189_9ZZZZ
MLALPDLLSSKRLRLLLLLVVNGLFQVGALITVAFLIRTMVDGIGRGEGLALSVIIAGLFGANLLLGLMKWQEMVAAQRLGEDYAMDMRRKAFRHLGTLSLHAQARLRGGSLQLRFVNDLTAIRNWISNGLARLLIATTICTGSIGALLVMDPILGLVLCGVVSIAIAGALLIGRMFDKTIREARKRRGQIAANISEKISNMPVIQAFAHLNLEQRKLKQQSRKLADAQIEKASVTGIFRGFMIFVIGSGIALMVVAASWSAGPNGPDIGALVSAIGLFSLLSPNLFRLGKVYEYWKSARIAQEKLARLFVLGPAIEPATQPKKPRKQFVGLQLENVSLAGALKSINCVINPSDRIVLKGDNGAGKTTLLNIILRLIEPDKGRVLLSGKDIRSIRTGDLRRQVSIISPSLGVMKGTVASNIAYGSSKADKNAVVKAASRCAMDCLNPNSPFHLGRSIHEGGRNLSAGERMRIIMARALVTSPRLLLLDEPETHLDTASLQVLIELLEGYEGAWLATSHGNALDHLAMSHWSLTNGKLLSETEGLAA